MSYTLVFFSNRITRDGCKEIAKMLRSNIHIRVLDLSFNRIGDEGARALAEVLLTSNNKLET